jgi:hypothetical protein
VARLPVLSVVAAEEVWSADDAAGRRRRVGGARRRGRRAPGAVGRRSGRSRVRAARRDDPARGAGIEAVRRGPLPAARRYWIGWSPTVDWPPQAPALARRCAAVLAKRATCEMEAWMYAPTDASLQAARNAIADELRLTPADLLAALADHWEQLADLEMPIGDACTLLAFAQHVLLEPVVGACAFLWSTLESPPSGPAPAETPTWADWSPVERDDWNAIVAPELDCVGQPTQRVPDHGDEAGALLVPTRAAELDATDKSRARHQHRENLRLARRHRLGPAARRASHRPRATASARSRPPHR